MKTIKLQKTLVAAAGTGYGTTLALPELGRSGRITHVKARLSATLDDMTSGRVILAEDDSSIDANTPDDDRVYESATTAFTGSATTADLAQDLAAAPRSYAGLVYAVLSVLGAGGGGASTSVTLTIHAEVEP